MMNALSPLECLATEGDLIQPAQQFWLTPLETKWKNPKYIHTLEYYWGFSLDGVVLETPMNQISLRPNVMALLRNETCALVPTPETLQKMQDFLISNENKPIAKRTFFADEFPQKEYEYIFLPLQYVKPLYIQRPDGDGYDRHDPPYANLPRFRSTAHPFFVTYHSTSALIWSIWKVDLADEIIDPIQRISSRKTTIAPSRFLRGPRTTSHGSRKRSSRSMRPSPYAAPANASHLSRTSRPEPLDASSVQLRSLERMSPPNSPSLLDQFIINSIEMTQNFSCGLPGFFNVNEVDNDHDHELAQLEGDYVSEPSRDPNDALRAKDPVWFEALDARRQLSAQDWIILKQRQEIKINPYPDSYFEDDE